MNQAEFLERLKVDINNFPKFVESLIKKPFKYIDTSYPTDWIQIILYCFLVEASTQVVFNLFLLNFSSLLGSLIFTPIQVLVVLGFLSFVLWFGLDRMGYSRLSILDIFKGLAFIEMIVSLFVLPVIIAASYIKMFELFYIVQVLVILAKAYLLYRVMSKQWSLENQKSLLVSGILAVLFLLPVVSEFVDNYEGRSQIRSKEQYNEKMMEESIKALEEEFKIED